MFRAAREIRQGRPWRSALRAAWRRDAKFFAFVFVVLVAAWQARLDYQYAAAVRTEVCRGRAVLVTTLADIIAASDKSLAGIQYYKDHPDELLAAHINNATEIARIRTAACQPRSAG